MPPKQRYTRDEMISAALETVRESGLSALTARALASKLSSSPKVIFGAFTSMDEVRSEVVRRAGEIYAGRMMEALASKDMPPYESCGICFVRFAHEEKELWRILFMNEGNDDAVKFEDTTLEAIYSAIMQGVGVTHGTAAEMHMKYSIFACGLAVQALNSAEPLDEEEMIRLLSENWEDLVNRYRR